MFNFAWICEPEYPGHLQPWLICLLTGKQVNELSRLSCPTLCNPMDSNLPGSSIHGDSPGKITGLGCHAFLQGIFLTQGLNSHLLCLLLWQEGSSPLAPPGKPFAQLSVSFSFSISPSNEYSELISFRMDWFDLLAVQGTLKSLLQHHSSKASRAFFSAQLSL